MNERGTPLDFLEDVMACEELPLTTRMKAAIAAAPFRHPKLGVQVNIEGGNLKEQMEVAHKRVAGLEEARAKGREYLVEWVRDPKRLADASKVIEGEAVEIKERD